MIPSCFPIYYKKGRNITNIIIELFSELSAGVIITPVGIFNVFGIRNAVIPYKGINYIISDILTGTNVIIIEQNEISFTVLINKLESIIQIILTFDTVLFDELNGFGL